MTFLASSDGQLLAMVLIVAAAFFVFVNPFKNDSNDKK